MIVYDISLPIGEMEDYVDEVHARARRLRR